MLRYKRDRGQLPLVEAERAGHRVLDVERAVELAVEGGLPEGAGRREVGEPHGPRVAGALPVEDERVVGDVGGKHARRVGKTRVRSVRYPMDRALREIELRIPGEGRGDDPGELRGHIRREGAGARHGAGTVDEVEKPKEVALAEHFHDARDSDSVEGCGRRP